MANPVSRERVKKINIGRERPERYNPILAIKYGIVYKSYPSAKFASADGYDADSIYQTCVGRRKTYRGMIWMYLSDYESLVQYIKELSLKPSMRRRELMAKLTATSHYKNHRTQLGSQSQ